jgi:hypothetical protein
MRRLLFIDITSNHTNITLPPEWEGRLAQMTLVSWTFEGVPFTYGLGGTFLGPYYAQIRFEGLRPNVITSTYQCDCVPVPLLVFGGWPPGQLHVRIPLGDIELPRRLTLDVYGEGSVRAPLTFTRGLMWVEVDIQ